MVYSGFLGTMGGALPNALKHNTNPQPKVIMNEY